MPEVTKTWEQMKTLQVQIAHLSERINTAGLLIHVSGANERSFRKMEMLEFEEEEESNAPIDIDDDDIYDNTDLFCEEDDGKDSISAQAVMRIFLPTLSNHADIWFVPTVSKKINVNYVDVEYPIT